MKDPIQFTRYLYIKDEVKLSILISLLKKNNEALFWAYEFYYSGFKEELWDLIWKIYYDFYASLNPNFKKFIKENYESWKIMPSDDKIIAKIISNFQIRPWNTDVFLLKEFAKKNKPSNEGLDTLLKNKNYQGIISYIMNSNTSENDKKILATYFPKTWSSKDELVANIVYFYSLQILLKLGKNLYLSDDEDISRFKTIFSDYNSSFYPYKILPLVTKCAIDKESMLSLFHLSRDSCPNLKREYNYNWLYHASRTPIWANRIQEFEGRPNHEKKEIEFDCDDDLDEFYDHFGYEPDEQKMEVQHRNIGPIKSNTTWKSVLEKNYGIYVPNEDIIWGKIIY